MTDTTPATFTHDDLGRLSLKIHHMIMAAAPAPAKPTAAEMDRAAVRTLASELWEAIDDAQSHLGRTAARARALRLASASDIGMREGSRDALDVLASDLEEALAELAQLLEKASDLVDPLHNVGRADAEVTA